MISYPFYFHYFTIKYMYIGNLVMIQYIMQIYAFFLSKPAKILLPLHTVYY
jgi:hypothetical protein